jgi:uncharacterized protein
MSHTQTVQQVYEAFGKGDIPAILAKLAPDVDWEYGGGSMDVPWLQPRRGREAVAGFFESLALLDFESFTPKTFLESGATVVVLVDFSGTVKATGKRADEVDEVHIWHFNDAGLVQRFRHRADTHHQWKAYHGR